MAVGEKLKRAREAQHPRVTQRKVAAMLGIKARSYQSYELGRAEPPELREYVEKLSAEWHISEHWFWDGRRTDPYADAIDEQSGPSGERMTAVRIYYPGPDGQLLISDDHSRMTAVEKHIADLGATGIEVPNDENAPRLLTGEEIFTLPPGRPKPGAIYYARINPELTLPSHGLQPGEVRGGVYVYDNGTYRLKPINPSFPSIPAEELQEFRLVVTRRRVHAPGWTTTEICPTGLPVSLPI